MGSSVTESDVPSLPQRAETISTAIETAVSGGVGRTTTRRPSHSRSGWRDQDRPGDRRIRCDVVGQPPQPVGGFGADPLQQEVQDTAAGQADGKGIRVGEPNSCTTETPWASIWRPVS